MVHLEDFAAAVAGVYQIVLLAANTLFRSERRHPNVKANKRQI